MTEIPKNEIKVTPKLPIAFKNAKMHLLNIETKITASIKRTSSFVSVVTYVKNVKDTNPTYSGKLNLNFLSVA